MKNMFMRLYVKESVTALLVTFIVHISSLTSATSAGKVQAWVNEVDIGSKIRSETGHVKQLRGTRPSDPLDSLDFHVVARVKTNPVYFGISSHTLDKSYESNASALLKIDATLDSLNNSRGVDFVVIHSSSSPEGNPDANKELARKRAIALKEYLLATHTWLADSLITIQLIPEAWEKLTKYVEEDCNAPSREEMLIILLSNLSSAQKEQRLKGLDNGRAFKYLISNFFGKLRSSHGEVLIFSKATNTIVQSEMIDSIKPSLINAIVDSLKDADLPQLMDNLGSEVLVADTVRSSIQQNNSLVNDSFLLDSSYIRPLALKTNLLFDLLTAINLEVEVPLHRRISLMGEWTFPWWLWNSKQYAIQVLSGGLELRYWLNPRFDKQEKQLGSHNPLSGWFVGAYGGAGLYDLEWGNKGYQGEFFIASGLSAGYVKPLSKNFSLELSLGVGYLKTKYSNYIPQKDSQGDWHLIYQNRGTYTWIGPTKAKVSLIWYPHLLIKKKGGSGR